MLKNYLFIVPRNSNTEAYLSKRYESFKQSSDGSPFCTIKEGYLVPDYVYETIPTVDVFPINILVYNVLGYDTKEDFITDFWDGECTDETFELVEE